MKRLRTPRNKYIQHTHSDGALTLYLVLHIPSICGLLRFQPSPEGWRKEGVCDRESPRAHRGQR